MTASRAVAERGTPGVSARARTWETYNVALLASTMRWFGRSLNGQNFAALVAPSFEYGAAGGRAHAAEKPVRAFAPQVAWLIGSFHCGSSVEVIAELENFKRDISPYRDQDVNLTSEKILASPRAPGDRLPPGAAAYPYTARHKLAQQ